jgi:protein-S-isoprenylcysteine O-methyltransferase Ste14
LQASRKLLPPAYLLIYVVTTAMLHFLFPVARIIRPPYVLLGILPLAFGLAINVWADGTFKRESTTVKPFETSAVLVTAGPFRFSRHPMYLGMVAVLLGEAVLLGSASAFVGPIAMIVTLEALFIPHEERSLEATFGATHTDYKKRVRRWL